MRNYILICVLVMCYGAEHALAQQGSARKPNVIYIYADDLGYGELGSYGQTKILTPHLDRMASEGMRFTQHYTSTPVCAPARCMLLTGKHGGHSYIRGNYELGGFKDDQEGGQMPLPEGTFTIAKMMKNAGYATAAIGKWGLGAANTTGHPNLQGFEYFYGYLDQKQAHNFFPTHLWENRQWDTLSNSFIDVHKPLPLTDNNPDHFNAYKGSEYSLTRMGEKSLAYIRQNKNKPFFLYLPYTAPHVSLQAPEDEIKAYMNKFEDKPYHGENRYTPTLYPRATYAAMITYLDKQVGAILDLLKELNLDENTIVMFSSDNGPTFDVGGVDTKFFNSTAGLRGRKMDLYEGGIREPFIARWPGKIPPGKVSDHVSVQFDLMQTLSELTGAGAPPNDGISFLPTLLGRSSEQKQHQYIFFEFPEKGGQVAVRMGKWKGVKSNMKKDRNAPWEIFDLAADGNETTDLALQHRDLAETFEAILKKEHMTSHIREWEFIEPRFTVQQ